MTGEQFVKMINFYGEENILGIGFDNSAAITFGKGEFSLTNNYVADLESIHDIGFDSRGNPFHVIRHVENVQCVIIRDSATPIQLYDRISIRP